MNFIPWGVENDVPYALDYDGDGKSDAAVFRPTTGFHWIRQSSNGAVALLRFGANGDTVVPGDYDGDGRDDLAVARPVAGSWRFFIRASDNGAILAYNLAWGLDTDLITQGDYNGDGATDIAVWRPSQGRFYVRTNLASGALSIFNWGTLGDTVVNNWNVH